MVFLSPVQDLEDAAQLGCSLYDWKFAERLASDRFQAVRKRRLASFLASPRSKFGELETPRAPLDDSHLHILEQNSVSMSIQVAAVWEWKF